MDLRKGLSVRGILKTLGVFAAVVAIPDAATVAQRWVAGATGAAQRYKEGVDNTTKDPTALAVAQVNKLQTNFIASITSGRWQRALQAVGRAGWQAAVDAKGAANYATGVQAGAQKYQEKIAPVLAYEASLQQRIQAMPKATLADSIARASAWITGMAQYKTGQ